MGKRSRGAGSPRATRMFGIVAAVSTSFWLMVAARPASADEGGAVGDPLAECEAQRAEPATRDRSWECFYRTGLKAKVMAEAKTRLETYLTAEPKNPRLLHALAQIETAAQTVAAGPAYDEAQRRALELYLRAIASADEQGDAEVSVRGRINLATRYRELKRWEDGGDAALDEAAAIADRAGVPLLQAYARNARAKDLIMQGQDQGRALRLSKEVESLVFPEGPLNLRYLCLKNLGDVSSNLGQYAAARGYYERALPLAREIGIGEATLLSELVKVRIEELSDEPHDLRADEVAAAARHALEVAVAAKNVIAETHGELHLAIATSGAEAVAHAETCVARAREQHLPALAIACNVVLAQKVAASDRVRADALIREADALAEQSRYPATRIAAALGRLGVDDATGDVTAFDRDALTLFEVIEHNRDLQRDDAAQTALLDRRVGLYTSAASRLLDRASSEPAVLASAFAIIERMRARALLDALDRAGLGGAVAGSGPVAERRQALLVQVAAVQRKLQSPTVADRPALLAELVELERVEAELRAEIATADPLFAAVRKPTFIALADLQRALRADQAFLSFQLGNRQSESELYRGSSWLLVITRGAVRAYRLPDRAVLEPKVASLIGLIERRDGSERAAAAALHRELLAPALADLPAGVDELVIVPDRALHRLPFAVLGERAPLIERFAVSYAPSATLWARFSTLTARAPRPAWIAADPALATANAAPATVREWELTSGVALAALPYARREGRTLAALATGSRLLTGADASEARFKSEDLASFGLFHFAAHAVIDDDNPERSAIVLAPGTSAEDGLLQPRDLLQLRLVDAMVVLSACRSASGAVHASEGVVGLGRAFFLAGARTFVGSHWPLRDDEAAAFFRTFYQVIGAGHGAAEALAITQRRLLRAGAPAAAWAAVGVWGDGETRPLVRLADRADVAPRWNRAAWIAAAVLAAATLLLALVLLRRRAR